MAHHLLSLLFAASFCFLQAVAEKTPARNVSTALFGYLEELSRLVDISYCVGGTGVQKPFRCLSRCEEFPDLELVSTWNTGALLSDSCGYIALSHSPSPKRIIIAFRGTYSLTNTIIDLSAYPQSYVPYPGDSDEDGNPDTNPNPSARCENCTVHGGFMGAWLNTRRTILPIISAAREQYPDYEVTLVGHSLGGAVAALAGLEMRLKGWDPQVTTFGEPMVGNTAFAQFLDEQFHLKRNGSSHKHHVVESSPAEEHQRFRRVTHVNDPVPLLPLQEWGYAPHAGEIFIAKPDLSPDLEDVQMCLGDRDPQCIAGSATTAVLVSMYREINIPVSAFSPDTEGCLAHQGGPGPGNQIVLGGRRRLGRSRASCETDSASGGALYPRSWDWSLIPARYRLWELFYAHRDYFWRIGLCMPGGDPTRGGEVVEN